MKNIVSLIILLSLVSCSKSRSGEDKSHGNQNAQKNTAFFKEIGAVTPYTDNGPNKKMKECIYKSENKDSCKLNELSLIGMEKNEITINDVLDRTLVSHKFLGDNFKSLLIKLNNKDLLKMFGAVNAIIISDKVTPSFYWSRTGAIYLSADYFWLTKEEGEKLYKKMDPRADYGQKFKFSIREKTVQNGANIHRGLWQDTRSINDIELPTTKLLFHELTHANDYFPKSLYKNSPLDKSKTYLEVSGDRYRKYGLLSDQFENSLASKTLLDLGRIAFHGEKETEDQLDLDAYDIAKEIEDDVAVAYYSYSSPREDLAMLVETLLMMRFYNIDKYITVVKFPKNNFKPTNEFQYPLAWGMKNKILETKTFERALYGAKAIFEDYDSSIYMNILDKKEVNIIPENTSYWDILKF